MIVPARALSERKPPYSGAGALGARGEEAAARHLESLGFRILERRFRTRAGEIDLVAEEQGTLVFVEVKSRSALGFGRPAEAVDARKRGRLTRAAAIYLMLRGLSDRPCRFDVLEVLPTIHGDLRCRLIRDAFQGPCEP
jgi:putative endonuclease